MVGGFVGGGQLVIMMMIWSIDQYLPTDEISYMCDWNKSLILIVGHG